MISDEPVPLPGVTLPMEETPKKEKKTLKEIAEKEKKKKAKETESKVVIDQISSSDTSTKSK